MNGSDLTRIQRGDRLYSLESKYRYLPWHPSSLFSRVMREAILALSNTPDVAHISTAACNAFMQAALQPGLDVRGINPYPLSQDFCATIRTVLEYISRKPLLALHKIKDVELESTYTPLTWSFLSPMDESGCFHRYVFVDSISEDAVYHHSRSWETWADMCVAPAMCYLHLIAIGRTDSGRRSSPWARCYSSPTIARLYKFKRKSGSLQGDWRPLYYADSTDKKTTQATTWVDLMEKEEVASSLVYSVGLPEPTQLQRNQFFSRDLAHLAPRIQAATKADPFSLPMCRSACDTPYPCPHESICYTVNPSVSILESSGLYAKIPARKVQLAQSHATQAAQQEV